MNSSRRADGVPLELINSWPSCTRAIARTAVVKLRLRLESDTRLEPPLLQCMGRSNSQKAWGYLGDSERAQRKEYLSGHAWWKRARPTRHQATPPTLNVDVHGVLFAVVAVVFVIYPLVQWALG